MNRLSLIFVGSLLSFMTISCGDSQTTQLLNNNSIQVTTSSCKEKIFADKRDTDGDGISDVAEIYGWNVMVDGLPTLVYTNPLLKDTDGDGRNDLDEVRTNQFIGGEGSTIFYSTHPAHRDALVSVDSQGLKVNGLSTSRHNTGWNFFELFRVQASDQFIFRDLQSSLWKGPYGLSGPLGLGANVNCLHENTECLKLPEMRLVARFVKSPELWSEGSTIVDLGSAMNFMPPVTSIQRNASDAGRILALRANDSDTDLANNSGSLHLMVRQITTLDYPQRPPTAEEENALFSQICK